MDPIGFLSLLRDFFEVKWSDVRERLKKWALPLLLAVVIAAMAMGISWLLMGERVRELQSVLQEKNKEIATAYAGPPVLAKKVATIESEIIERDKTISSQTATMAASESIRNVQATELASAHLTVTRLVARAEEIQTRPTATSQSTRIAAATLTPAATDIATPTRTVTTATPTFTPLPKVTSTRSLTHTPSTGLALTPTPFAATTLTPIVASSEAISEYIRTAFDQLAAKVSSSYGARYVSDSNSRRVFGWFIEETAEYPQEDVISVLLGFLTADEAITRWKAMRFLLYLQYDDSQVIRDFWFRELDYAIRKIVLEAVENLPPEESVQILADVIKFDDYDSIRRSAVEQIGDYVTGATRQKIVSVCLDALSDDSPSVQAKALDQLRNLKAAEALDLARSMLLSTDYSVPTAASWYLSELGPLESYEDVLSAFLRDHINEYVFKGSTKRYTDRFGEDAIKGKTSNISDPNEREKVEEALK